MLRAEKLLGERNTLIGKSRAQADRLEYGPGVSSEPIPALDCQDRQGDGSLPPLSLSRLAQFRDNNMINFWLIRINRFSSCFFHQMTLCIIGSVLLTTFQSAVAV